MNVSRNEVDIKENVVPLFGRVEDLSDPLRELLMEGLMQLDQETEEQESLNAANRIVVSEAQFPDQSMYVLDKQLHSLRESLDRIRFYIGDVEDLLPR